MRSGRAEHYWSLTEGDGYMQDCDGLPANVFISTRCSQALQGVIQSHKLLKHLEAH